MKSPCCLYASLSPPYLCYATTRILDKEYTLNNRTFIGLAVLTVVRVVSKVNRRLFLPRTSCLRYYISSMVAMTLGLPHVFAGTGGLINFALQNELSCNEKRTQTLWSPCTETWD